jgi:hypothetical protein
MALIRKIFRCVALLIMSLPGLSLAEDLIDMGISPPIGMESSLSFGGGGAKFSDEMIGDWQMRGVLTGLAAAQSNTSNNSPKDFGDVSNAQVMLQKTSGWLQAFVAAGAYDMPALAANYRRTYTQTEGTWGFLPLGWVSIVPSPEWRLDVGKMLAIGGGENTLTYQNFNIQRGLLATVTNMVTKGVQLNYLGSDVTASVAWTNGTYSNTYNWLSGQVQVPFNNRHSVLASWTGALSSNAMNTMATPLLQNNSQITNLIYTYNSDYWSLAPYLQMTVVPAAPEVGILGTSGSQGIALLGAYRFTPLIHGRTLRQNVSLPVRLEYFNTWGNSGFSNNNLMFGPNSAAWSATLTPTWQRGMWFGRLEGSYVRALNPTQGAAFGLNGNSNSQTRVMLEIGMLY